MLFLRRAKSDGVERGKSESTYQLPLHRINTYVLSDRTQLRKERLSEVAICR